MRVRLKSMILLKSRFYQMSTIKKLIIILLKLQRLEITTVVNLLCWVLLNACILAISAEDLVISKFIPPSNANIIMTSAIRPWTGEVIAVCTRCQTKFPVNQFIKGTVFD